MKALREDGTVAVKGVAREFAAGDPKFHGR